jgi:hypothetical protein
MPIARQDFVIKWERINEEVEAKNLIIENILNIRVCCHYYGWVNKGLII